MVGDEEAISAVPSGGSSVCLLASRCAVYRSTRERCPVDITVYGSLLWQFKTRFVWLSGLEFRFHPLVSASLSGSTNTAEQGVGGRLSTRLASGQYPPHRTFYSCGVTVFPQCSRQACSDWYLSAGTFSSLFRCSRKI